MTRDELIRKYDVPVPRYTSYPTVPAWDATGFSMSSWWKAVGRCFAETNSTKGISLYIHLPFCESLCTYCACNTRITRNHRVEESYLQAVLKEWKLYNDHFNAVPVIREMHLGGGTPTFFQPDNLKRMVKGILEGCLVHDEFEFSFEGHPNNTTGEHLQVLAQAGFRRVSFGVQDLDPKVQKAINRIQPFENLAKAVACSRSYGYKSVSFDLIYGLPYQTVESIKNTIAQVLTLRPDRIAFYSYAHVPWIKPGQRGYEDADLPADVVKRQLYEEGRTMFLAAGYRDVGMDHFALPDDHLFKAQELGTLHRNFMGYTTNQTDLLIGLGASSISESMYAYAQNVKKVEEYENLVTKGGAIAKGHMQTSEDLQRRRTIMEITCRGRVDVQRAGFANDVQIMSRIREMIAEGILREENNQFVVTPLGRAFVRNIASIFDAKLSNERQSASAFSRAI
jgi:oxygen-independent coproporphyrinogen III oxidase